MNWELVAALAELLGALGVILSLVYLARQLRNNAAQSRQAAVQSVVTSFNSAMAAVAELENAEIWARGASGLAALSDYTELSAFSSRMLTIMRPFEELFYYQREGRVDIWLWESLSGMMHDIVNTPGVTEWWAARKSWMSPAFRAYVEAELMAGGQRDLAADYDPQ